MFNPFQTRAQPTIHPNEFYLVKIKQNEHTEKSKDSKMIGQLLTRLTASHFTANYQLKC